MPYRNSHEAIYLPDIIIYIKIDGACAMQISREWISTIGHFVSVFAILY